MVLQVTLSKIQDSIYQFTRPYESQAEIEIARKNINNPRYAGDTTLMAENEEELKTPLDEGEWGEWKSWLEI